MIKERSIVDELLYGDYGDQMKALNEIKRVRCEGSPDEKGRIRDQLTTALTSKEADIRALAALGLEYLMDPGSMEALTKAFNNEENPEARKAILRALEAIHRMEKAEEAAMFRKKLEKLIGEGRVEEAVREGLGGAIVSPNKPERQKVKKGS